MLLLSQIVCCAALGTAKPPNAAPVPAVKVVAQVTATGRGELPKPADSFVDAVGADTHFNYPTTPYVTQWEAVSAALIDSGIRHIRDGGTPNPAYLERLNALGQHGIKHAASFLTNVTPAAIRTRLAAFAPYVDFVEPQNEYDGNRKTDLDWVDHIVSEQKTLYATVHGDAAYSGITVLGPPLANADLYAALGPLDQYEDAGNIHWAPCDRNPGTQDRNAIARVHALARASTLTKPLWATETGYGDDMVRRCTLSDDTIAKYYPRTVAERFNAGEPRIFFYQFADMPSDKVFGSMGMLRADGTPKPQYDALRNLLHLLSDPGPAFEQTPLQFSLGGNVQNVHHTLLQKRDGRYELLLWQEVPSWDPLTRTPISVPVQNITLSLPPSIRLARLHAYTPAWTLASTPLAIQNGAVRLSVSDAISVVELGP